MKFNLMSSLKNLIERIGAIVIATFDSLPHLCKYSYSYISNYIKQMDMCDDYNLDNCDDYKQYSVYKEFNMILNALNNKTSVNFKINDVNLESGEYQYLIINGEYQSLLDYDIYIDECTDFEKYYREGDKYPKEKYTKINVYYRPLANNYLIENYSDYFTYESVSSYTKVLDFHELMDYIHLNIEEGYKLVAMSI